VEKEGTGRAGGPQKARWTGHLNKEEEEGDDRGQPWPLAHR
jgi:hypothetical protein